MLRKNVRTATSASSEIPRATAIAALVKALPALVRTEAAIERTSEAIKPIPRVPRVSMIAWPSGSGSIGI